MSDLIDRQMAIDALEETKQSDPFNRYDYQNVGVDWSIDTIKALPSAQPEPFTVTRDHLLTKDECDRLKQAMRETPILLFPSVQPEPEIIACGDCKHYICHDRRCGYWNHGVKPLEWCCHGEERNG